jgi:hypothetical protein
LPDRSFDRAAEENRSKFEGDRYHSTRRKGREKIAGVSCIREVGSGPSPDVPEG